MQSKLGERVNVAATMTRRLVIKHNEFGYRERHKEWQVSPVTTPTEGIIVGIRTLSDGVNIWIGEGDGYDYQATRYFKVYLVVTDIYKKPLVVPF